MASPVTRGVLFPGRNGVAERPETSLRTAHGSRGAVHDIIERVTMVSSGNRRHHCRWQMVFGVGGRDMFRRRNGVAVQRCSRVACANKSRESAAGTSLCPQPVFAIGTDARRRWQNLRVAADVRRRSGWPTRKSASSRRRLHFSTGFFRNGSEVWK